MSNNFTHGTKRWAVQQMLEGKKVTKMDWLGYMYMDNELQLRWSNGNRESMEGYADEGWNLYEEPKKVTYYKYFYIYKESGSDVILETSGYVREPFEKYVNIIPGAPILIKTEERVFEIPEGDVK